MLWRKRLSAHPEENAVTAVHPQNAIFTHLVGELSGRVSGAPRRDTKDYVRIRPRFRVPADLSVVAQIILCPALLQSNAWQKDFDALENATPIDADLALRLDKVYASFGWLPALPFSTLVIQGTPHDSRNLRTSRSPQ